MIARWLLLLLALLPLACGVDRPDDPGPAYPNPPAPTSDAGVAPLPAGDVPCAVAQILVERCQSCHGESPRYGAPMALVDAADFAAGAVTRPEDSVGARVLARISDPSRPMPPSGMLSPDERAILYDWLTQGAPAGEACGVAPSPPVVEPSGPEVLPCTPTHSFVAHGETEDAPFVVPTEPGNLYQCFTFRSPFGPTTRATAWAPITDDARVLHHWILYRTHQPQPEGGSGPCQMPSDATFMAGWAPGGGNFVMPEDVGLEVPGPDDYLILQVHYHNTAGHQDARDRSGVALCTTETPRPKTAGFFTLGTVRIDVPPLTTGLEVSGVCGSVWTRFLSGSLQVMASFPHMHQLGRRLRTEIWRGGDQDRAEVLVDVEHFDFENQRYYAHDPPVEFRPGDAVRTTCTFDNPTERRVTFGEKTEDEMCFNFVMLYPIEGFGDGRQCGVLF